MTNIEKDILKNELKDLVVKQSAEKRELRRGRWTILHKNKTKERDLQRSIQARKGQIYAVASSLNGLGYYSLDFVLRSIETRNKRAALLLKLDSYLNADEKEILNKMVRNPIF